MKIIDCFPFFDEFLILDIRFKELYDIVDKFYIVESKETFSGKPKELLLSNCLQERYPQYADKIEIVVPEIYNDNIQNSNYQHYPMSAGIEWRREYFQKNHISHERLKHLNLADDDIILFSDADEIPKKWAIEKIKNGWLDELNLDFGGFGGNTYYYKFNMLTTEWSYRPSFSKYKNFKNHSDDRYLLDKKVISDSGWHFSYIKTPAKIKEKIEAFSHQEFNNTVINTIDNIEQSVRESKDLFHRSNISIQIVEIDNSFPEYIKENKNQLLDWIA